MHRLIASSCLYIINHFHSWSPGKQQNRGEGGPHWDGSLRSGLLIPRAQVFPVPRNQTTPSLCPSLPWPMLSPSLLPAPRKLLEGTVYSTDSTAFSLSPASTPITSTAPQTPPAPDPRTRFSAPCLASDGITIYPAAQVRKLNFVPPSPSAKYPGHPKSFDFTTKTYLEFISSSPWLPAWSEPPSPLTGVTGSVHPPWVPSATPHTVARRPCSAKDHDQPLPHTFSSPE